MYCVERIAIIPLTKDSNPEIIGLEVQLGEKLCMCVCVCVCVCV